MKHLPGFLAAMLCVLLWAYANMACAETPMNPADFMRANKIPENLAADMLNTSERIKVCDNIENQLVCVQGRIYPGVAKNGVARQGVLKNLEFSVLQQLRKALVEIVPSGLLNSEVTGEALGLPASKNDLKGMQFITYCRADWCGALALAPLKEAKKDLPIIYGKAEFVKDYCKLLLPIARAEYEKGNYKTALDALKELHDLKFANAEAYLLAMEAFMREKMTGDAVKIANEILDDLPDQLSASQAEQLGDFFLELNQDDNAIKSFQLASSKIAEENAANRR